MVASLPFYGFLWPAYEQGAIAVQIFWAVSGFIFYHNYAARIAEGRVRPLNFAWLRFSRLYPLHIVTLFAVALLQIAFYRLRQTTFVYHSNDAQHFLLHVFFASNWLQRSPFSFNAPVWSVSVEVLIYGVFYVVVRYGGSGLTVAGATLAACIVCALGHHDLKSVAQCGVFFFTGGLVDLFFTQTGELRRQFGRWWNLGLVGVLVLETGIFFAVPRMRIPLLEALVAIGPIILLTLNLGQRLSGRAERVTVAFGNLTYASYLIHFPIQIAVVTVVLATTGSTHLLHSPWLLPAFVIGTLGLARLVFLYFELPAQHFLRERLTPKRSVANA